MDWYVFGDGPLCVVVLVLNVSLDLDQKKSDGNPLLTVDDYGVHVGTHVFRATFPSTSTSPTGIQLALMGGSSFGATVWLNSRYIGSHLGSNTEDSAGLDLSFEGIDIATDGEENVLLVVMDNAGKDLRAGALNPRGITGAALVGGDDATLSWKLARNVAGTTDVDLVRGLFNEGALFAERTGMHLPGYDSSSWPALTSSTTTLSVQGPGISVFRTTLPLSIDSSLDASISFRLTSPLDGYFTPALAGSTDHFRALLFINGYQYGRFNPYIGNQIDFPVPPGVLDYEGENTVVVMIWCQDEVGGGCEMGIEANVDWVAKSGFERFDGEYLRPGWDERRMRFA